MRCLLLVVVLSSAACRIDFDLLAPEDPGDPEDPDDPSAPEPAFCTAPGATCAGLSLRTCAAAGVKPVDLPCDWGCIAAATGTTAHCGKLQPRAFSPGVIDGPSAPLADLELDDAYITAAGGIALEGALFEPPIRSEIEGEQSGIEFHVYGGVGVYRVNSLHITGHLQLLETNWNNAVQPIAIVSMGPIVIDGFIDGQNACLSDDTAAPGGYPGNAGAAPSGAAPSTQSAGGGGGGNGAVGGASGGSGGNAIAALALVGGGGGGGSGSSSLHHGVGGAGGAALQLVSSTSITIGPQGAVNAGGCGGFPGDTFHGAGGGGAGGTLVFQAPAISVEGKLAVNGGAGGSATTGRGEDGLLSRVAASHGGGLGGVAGSPAGGQAPSTATGGGGAIGRIRFETLTGEVSIAPTALLSPDLDDALTTATATQALVE